MIKNIELQLSCSKTLNQQLGISRDYFVQKKVLECPYCKEKLNLRMPSVINGNRKNLSSCYYCHKDIVVESLVKKVTVKYDVKIKKVG